MTKNHCAKNKLMKASQIFKGRPYSLLFFLALIILLVWGSQAGALVPPRYPEGIKIFWGDVVGPKLAASPLFAQVFEPWFRWDTHAYLSISADGHGRHQVNLAYAPLYPVLIRWLGGLLGGQYLLAALFISWLSLLAALGLLYQRYWCEADRETALRAIRYLLFFPSAFFFFAGYSESLFLLLLLLSWRDAEKAQFGRASLWACLATLCRFQGIFIALPLAYFWLSHHWGRLNGGWAAVKISAKELLLSAIPIGFIPLTYLAWSLYVYLMYGVTPDQALNEYWQFAFSWPWEGVWGNMVMLLTGDTSQIVTVVLDLGAVMLAAAAIIWVVRSKRYAEALFIAAVLLSALVKVNQTNTLVSTARYVLPLFPIYLMLAKAGRQRWAAYLWFTTSALAWFLASMAFFSWLWIG